MEVNFKVRKRLFCADKIKKILVWILEIVL